MERTSYTRRRVNDVAVMPVIRTCKAYKLLIPGSHSQQVTQPCHFPFDLPLVDGFEKSFPTPGCESSEFFQLRLGTLFGSPGAWKLRDPRSVRPHLTHMGNFCHAGNIRVFVVFTSHPRPFDPPSLEKLEVQ